MSARPRHAHRNVPLTPAPLVIAGVLAGALGGCGDDDPVGGGDAWVDAVDDVADATGDAVDATDGSGSDTGSDVPTDAPGEVWAPEPRAYEATIRRTEAGIPHILAADVPSVAFGQGYAFAEDHACTLADQIVAVRSERSLYFGPGEGDANLNNDFGILALGVYEHAEDGLRSQPQEIQEAVLGYVSGYNQYLEDRGPDGIHSLCRGADWVRPLTDIDLYAYYLYLGELGSGLAMLDFIATAAPPESADQKSAPPPLESLPNFREMALGSNGWGIGSARSSTGRGMLLGNPHFPYRGELAWHESHLTVPGEMNVYGASLMGVAAINIGFTDAVAWTHTVSAAPRFTMYRLRINPENATQYEFDGGWRDMESRELTVQVRGDDGTLRDVTRTFYTTVHGPMLNAPVFGWSRTMGFAMRNANARNDRLIEQWWRMNRAGSLAEFQAAHAEVRGIPWVNTMAADAEGTAWYADSSAVPNLTAEAEAGLIERIAEDQITQTFFNFGIYLLPGGDPAFLWEEQEGAREPGLIPYAEAPKLERDDFIFNANDSHWLTNPLAPLEGYSFLYGGERTPRSLRTRMNARMLTEEGSGSMWGADGVATLAELQAAALANRSMVAELVRDELVALCTATPLVVVPGAEGDESEEVDLSEACQVLAAWNGRFELDQAGPALLREAMSAYTGADVADAGSLFETPFDPADPVNTPADVVDVERGTHPLLVGLGEAVQRLASIGFGPGATLGELQFTRKGDEEIPIFGGSERDGTISIATWGGPDRTLLPDIERGALVNPVTDLTEDGYVVDYGNSFVLTVQFTDEGPEAGAFVTYSASSDPESPHWADQTRAYADKAWRTVRFTEEAIAADPALRTYTVTYAP